MHTLQHLDALLNFQPYLLNETGWTIYSPLWLDHLKQLDHPVFKKLQSHYDTPKTFLEDLTKHSFTTLNVLTITLTQPPSANDFFQYLLTKYPKLSPNTNPLELHHTLETEIPQFFFQPHSPHFSQWQHSQTLSQFFHYWNEIITQQIDPVALKPFNERTLFMDLLGSLIALMRQQLKCYWAQHSKFSK